MKKWLAGVLIVVVLLIACSYVFIPSTIVVSNVRYIHEYQNSVIKFFNDSVLLNNWWKSVSEKEGANYKYKGYDYQIKSALSNLVEINIHSGEINGLSTLISANIYMDSSAIQWSTEIKASINPFERIRQYKEAKKLKDNMAGLMDALEKHLNSSTNIYGIDVKEIKLKDSMLISSKINAPGYPTVSEIYSLVKKLRDYATSQHAYPTDYPMLNVTQVSENNCQVMVGLPINIPIKETNEIQLKKMPYMKSMFIANIVGGDHAIRQGLDKLKEYYFDSRRASPAIPYQLMVTDRLNQPDTSKWVTTLYYPIM
jgi:hypothetical protein